MPETKRDELRAALEPLDAILTRMDYYVEAGGEVNYQMYKREQAAAEELLLDNARAILALLEPGWRQDAPSRAQLLIASSQVADKFAEHTNWDWHPGSDTVLKWLEECGFELTQPWQPLPTPQPKSEGERDG